ncbi:M10 family metallopeptidase C-terminal domain-containing protein [Sediminicoccus sp. KRV36]|uniref:M10 family metallopeptidase C-terminal domain-containing protein n=1 Tax=Sediminicoccus sp. KRV36 TaxID=3133721 RepID=UPI00200CBAAE|nr:M10 family metallopeptidase C-terminal domain-containing protein [Sediminicoccus rosea]UPY37247.1 M10 family metallopeptidase C-terminal domain-containing protein [Sediminicoccus rosea]
MAAEPLAAPDAGASAVVSGDGSVAALAGNSILDALLNQDLDLYWNSGRFGTGVNLSYNSPSWYFLRDPKAGTTYTFSTQDSAYADQAIATWNELANINLVRINASAEANIEFRLADLSAQAGSAYYPNSQANGLDVGGNIYIDTEATNRPNARGTSGFETLIHEIGHALGLKHPGSYNAGGGITEGPYLPASLDNTLYSIMSYNQGRSADSQAPQRAVTPMLFDVLAIQYVYGANYSTRSGNTLYTLSASTSLNTIWDAAGQDTLQALGSSSVLDLRQGAFSSTDLVKSTAIAYGVNIEDAIGTTGTDSITGNALGNRLRGLAGNDQLHGLEGDDILDGGPGVDGLYGGSGFDYASYENAAAGVAAFLTTPNSNTGEANGDGYSSIEGMVGSGFGDTLIADEGFNILIGLAGNDVLFGAGGNDSLYGGDGDDSFFGGTGADVLDGGAGFDYARYDFAVSNVAVFMFAPDSSSFEANGDIFINIEGLIGSNFPDTLFGDEAVNVLSGLNGNDVLFGAGGGDALYGGENDDSFFGGAGADYHNGGNGYDYVRFDFAAAGVTASLASGTGTGGEATGDIYVACEAFLGSEFNDALVGDGGNNVLVGNGGDDVLVGNAGIDSVFGGPGRDALAGGPGVDALYGGDGADVFYFSLGEGGDTIFDFSSSVDRILLMGSSFGFAPGASLDGRFVFGAAPTSSLSQFIYDPNAYVLYFDSNGIGAGGLSVVCTVQGGATMTQQDLAFV